MIRLNSTARLTMGNPMGYTLGEAARATGKTKATISKAIKRGAISATRGDGGEYDIDPAELHRVYPLATSRPAHEAVSASTPVNIDLFIETRELKAKLEAISERERLKDQMIEDLRQDRDKWRQQATALLTDQRSRQRRWWPWGQRLKE